MPGPRFGRFAGLRATGNKFGNKKCEWEGIKFDSQRERDVFMQYRMLEKAGKITQLEPHPIYRIVINGVKIGKYTPDFQFREMDGSLRVFDVKSKITAATTIFRFKKRCVEALYKGVKIEVVY